MVLTGSRASSRRVTIRLDRACPVLDTGLTPNRCRPTARPFRGSWGSRRFRHSGQIRAMKTCSVTSAGHTGSSMTSRVRCTQPPLRVVWHSGQDSGAWTTRPAGSIRGRAKPWGRFFARLLLLLRRLLAPGGRFMPRHPGSRSAAGQPGLQALNPLAQFGNRALLPGDDPLLFRDNRQQSLPRTGYGGFPARLLQVQFRFHCSFMPQLRSNRWCFHQDSGLRQIHLINSELLPTAARY